MNTTSFTINDVLEYFGNQSALARRLGIKPQFVQEWVSTNHLPIRRAIQIKRIKEGKIRLEEIIHLTGVEKETPCLR